MTTAPPPLLPTPASAPFNLDDETLLAQQELKEGQALAAAQRMEAAVARTGGHVPSWNCLGSARVELKLWASAEEAFWHVARLAPDTFPCWYNLLVCACRSQAPAQVILSRRRMVAAVMAAAAMGAKTPAPEEELRQTAQRVVQELGNHGNAQANAQALEEAARHWLSLGGGDEARLVLGRTLNMLNRYQESLLIWQELLDHQPDEPNVWIGLGIALSGADHHAPAIAWYRRVLERLPHNPAVMHNLMYTLQFVGEQDEGLVWIERAIAEDPQARYRMARATPLLRKGRYREGYAEYEQRLLTYEKGTGFYDHAFRLRDAGIALWQGESLQGKRIFVHPEQGHGDFIMCARLIAQLPALGASQVGFFAVNNLERYGRALPLGDKVRYQSEARVAENDFYVPLLSLMHYLGHERESDIVPPVAPVLDADTQAVWQERITGPAVGLTWRGSGLHPLDRFRTMSFDQFVAGVVQPLLSAGVPLVSLQKDVTDEERQHLQALGMQCDWIDQCADWYDSAALVQQLAAVVGVDTALIHLSGTLGVPTVMMNRIASLSDWRWLWQRADSPWYPSLRIVTQTALGEWDAPMAQAVQAVQEAVRELTALPTPDKKAPGSAKRPPAARRPARA